MNTLSKISFVSSLATSFAFFGCASQTAKPATEAVVQNSETAAQTSEAVPAKEKSIVIVYENDAHCAVNGYAQFAGMRDAIADTAYVLTVSSGDYLQGGAMGSFSRGSYIVDMINSAGYDVITLGNHEFDFAVDRLMELSKNVKADIVNVNFSKAGSAEPIFKPYVMKTVGSKKIAFVGVLSPETLIAESHAFYDGEGKAVYQLHENEIYTLVQNATNDARKNGADYVIVLAHLGELPPINTDVTSVSLIQNTEGINAILDGHMHSVIPEMWVANAKGDSVLLTQAGTKFSHVGKLDIDANGRFRSSLIPVDSATAVSPKVKATADSLNNLTDEIMRQELTQVPFELTIDKDGKRVIRNGETNLGDLVADSYRKATGAQIGLANGGGIRLSISQGTLTYRNILDVSPFFNDICKIEATGKQIVEALEQGSQKYPEEYGGFLQVSGIRYTIDPAAEQRVSDVQIEDDDGNLTPIEMDRLYTVGLSSYVAKKGTEITAFRPSKMLVDNIAADSDVLTDYFKSFNGSVPDKYRESQGRITIK